MERRYGGEFGKAPGVVFHRFSLPLLLIFGLILIDPLETAELRDDLVNFAVVVPVLHLQQLMKRHLITRLLIQAE